MRRIVSTASVVVASLVLATVAFAAVSIGTDGADVLRGGPADDALYGLAGDDTIAGGAGDDALEGGPGADDLRGDAGQDAATYAQAVAPLRVTLDDEADDGAVGERDNVHRDIEDVYGGAGADELIGSAEANTLDGGAGNDTLIGGAGTDGLYGGDGDDTVNARDGGVDTVDCGAGRDTFIVDVDDIVTGCETRARPPRVIGILSATYRLTARDAVFTTMRVRDISEDGATVELRCSGRGCPVRFRSFAVPDGTVPVNLGPLFRNRRLRRGATIEVRILAPGRVGRVQRLTVARKRLVSATLCLDPGAARPGAC